MGLSASALGTFLDRCACDPGLGQDCFTFGQCERDYSGLITPQLAAKFRVQAAYNVLLLRNGLALAPDGPEDDRAYCVLAAGRKSSLRRLGIGFTFG
jgi:hypothetical protein